jgi:hypothetical protein
MSTSIRPAFARPIEHVTESDYDFSIGSNQYSIASGVYANVISLARALVSEATELTNLQMTDGVLIQIYSTSTATLTWSNTDLRDALGFSGTTTALTASSWTTAAYLSPYLWIPEHHFADQSGFRQENDYVFVGSRAINGMVAGIGNGDVAFIRKMTFKFELATNLGREFCTTEQAAGRCLDEFWRGSLCAAPALSGSPSPKGFWLYYNLNELIADCTPTGSEWEDSGGINFSRTSSPDTYVFCQFTPDGLDDWRDNPGFPVGRLRYDVSVEFCTSPASGDFL